MKRFFGLLLLLLSLTACVPDVLLPSSYTFTSEAMQHALDKSFPLEKQYAGLLDLTLSQPKIELRPTEKRVVLYCRTTLTLLAGEHPVQGELQVSSQLAYDVTQRTVVLQNPKLEKETLSNISASMTPILQNITAVLVQKKLDGLVVYTFAPDQLRVLGTTLVPDDIDITSSGVVLHVKPAA